MPDQTPAPVVSLPVGAPINTADQLDALPVGSVVHDGTADWHKRRDGNWLCDDGDVLTAGGLALYANQGDGSLTLYVPGVPVPAPTGQDASLLALIREHHRVETAMGEPGSPRVLLGFIGDLLGIIDRRSSASSVPVDTTTEWGVRITDRDGGRAVTHGPIPREQAESSLRAWAEWGAEHRATLVTREAFATAWREVHAKCSFCDQARDDLSTGGDLAVCGDCVSEGEVTR